MAKIENLEYLTKKQLVVLFLWCHEGMTNEEIAKHLKRDAKTIQTHFSKIYTILEIETKGKTTDEIRYE
jgi:DNA-binding NarL/FixJ family response regulator